MQLLPFVKGLQAGRFCLAGRIRPPGRRLLTPSLDYRYMEMTESEGER